VLSAHAARVGKHRAQAELQTVLAAARADGRSLSEAVIAAGVLDRAELDALVVDVRIPTAEHAVDVVTAGLRGLLDATPEQWT